MVGSGFPVSVPIVGILPMVAGFGLLSWISSPLNILGSARRIVSGSPLSWGLGFDIASNLHGTDEGNSHHDKEGYCLFLYLFLSSVVWSGKNVYVFSEKHVRLLWKTCTCFFRNIIMFLRMMIINDLHIRVICMLIVWIYWVKIHTFAFDQFCSCYEMVKGNVFVHGRFCRIDCGRQRFFLPKGGTGVCFYIFIFNSE